MSRDDRRRRARRAGRRTLAVVAAGLVAVLPASLISLGGARAAAGSTASRRPASVERTGGSAKPELITIDGRREGATYQGIGAISGGGGNSRLIIDYPPAERTAILDYLFKPNYGASLQLLKLEIGGDANSSDGSEPSVEHTVGAVDCSVGYEFWLAQQALRLNPNLQIYGLQWAAPGFVRSTTGNNLWTEADIHYLIDWLHCAYSLGIPVHYLGGWNEHYRGHDRLIENWYVSLRKALDENGFPQVHIVAADDTTAAPKSVWQVATDMEHDKAFDRAVSVIGVHDICGDDSGGYLCHGSRTAQKLSLSQGKPLWQSELGHTSADASNPLDGGPGSLARSINNSTIDAMTTGTLLWPMADSMVPYLPFEERGLVIADQPWSGNYQVTPLTWVIAQTTQATAPGWRIVNGAKGFLPNSGSYVSYESPNRSTWSMVLQTSRAPAPQQLRIHVTGGLPARTIQVWATELKDGDQLAHVAVIRSKKGWFGFRALPGYVYTLTNMTSLSKAGGHAPPVPKSAPLGLPYSLQQDGAGMGRLLSPMEGAFAYRGGILTQTAAAPSVDWRNPGPDDFPYAVLGGRSWANYTVSAAVLLPAGSTAVPDPGAVLIARFRGYNGVSACEISGYELVVKADGSWQIDQSTARGATVLKQGQVAASHSYTMSLTTVGDRLSASIDGLPVGSVTATKFNSGLAGLGATGYDAVSFPTFSVTSPQATTPPPIAG